MPFSQKVAIMNNKYLNLCFDGVDGEMPAKKTTKRPAKKAGKAKSPAPAKRPTAAQQQLEMEQTLKARKQIVAIILFAVSIFLFCLTIIPGTSAWEAIRGFVFGLFGFCAFIWPLVLIYVAIMASLDKPTDRIGVKILEAAIFITLLCSVIHVLSFIPSESLWADIKTAYTTGISHANGGVFGAVLGGAFMKLFGKAAAAATLFILIFVDLMFMTGFTLIRLFRTIWKPVKKIEEYSEERIQQRELKRKPFNVDVDLGPTTPAPDIFKDEDTQPLPDLPKPAEPKKKPEKAAVLPQPKPVVLDDLIKTAAPQAEPEPSAPANVPVPVMQIPDPEPVGGNYQLPPVSRLNPPKNGAGKDHSEELKANAQRLVDTLKSFGVETSIVAISRGPSVTRYELQPAIGVKISKITNLADDIALNLAASGVRIEAPIPNKPAVGIEVPNKARDMVTAREIIDTPQFRQAGSKLTVALGKDIAGNAAYADLAKMPHLLIAGTTGSGKSVCLNSMIVSMLYHANPDEVKFLMIDPKKVEFSIYNGIPHLLVPVVGDPRNAAGALAWAVTQMLERYKLFSDNNVRDLKGYNQLCKKDKEKQPLPQIVIIIDELSDLMMAAPNEVEDSICRLAQMARAAGMHLLIATQRPSVDVITGIIKANIPSRIALSVSSQVDSRTILDMAGAEKLLGNGDMLFNPVGNAKPVRIQGCFLSDEEVESVVNFIKEQEQSNYDEDVMKEIESMAVQEKKKGNTMDMSSGGDDPDDEMLPKAIEAVVEAQQASATLLQRRLRLGYARAARIIDELEQRGIVGPYEGSKPRKVLLTKEAWMEMNALDGSGATQNSTNEDNANG